MGKDFKSRGDPQHLTEDTNASGDLALIASELSADAPALWLRVVLFDQFGIGHDAEIYEIFLDLCDLPEVCFSFANRSQHEEENRSTLLALNQELVVLV